MQVTGGFGEKPTLTVPSTPAPTALTTDVLNQGNGPAVAAGQSIVVNYLGPDAGRRRTASPTSSTTPTTSKTAAAFPIGGRGVIPGWNKTLVGQKAGSRLLLTVPPVDGYGTAKDPNQALAGQTLLFVVDVLGSYDEGATATGTPAGAPPRGPPAGEVGVRRGARRSPRSRASTRVKDPEVRPAAQGHRRAHRRGKSLRLPAPAGRRQDRQGAPARPWGGQGPQAAAASSVVQLGRPRSRARTSAAARSRSLPRRRAQQAAVDRRRRRARPVLSRSVRPPQGRHPSPAAAVASA